MTKSTLTKKYDRMHGTKLVLAALSIAATVTGWAWLSTQESALGGDNAGSINAAGTFGVESGIRQARNVPGTFGVQVRSARRIPNLATLPVRGMHEVRGAGYPAANDGIRGVPQTAPDLNTPLSTQQSMLRRRTRSSR